MGPNESGIAKNVVYCLCLVGNQRLEVRLDNPMPGDYW